jgi:hypothetical protein
MTNLQQLNALRNEALAATCAHDAASPVLSSTQFADGLAWLLCEFQKTMAPFATRKEYEPKTALCRLFQISNYRVEAVLKRHRIRFKLTPTGKRVFHVAEFEDALRANNS